jgi:DNA end-binding protein Ku
MRDAMRDREMAALGRVVLSRREHVVMLEAFDKGILATTLRYAYEVREQGAYFEDIDEVKLPGEMKDLAAHIVETKAGHFDPKDYEDHYETAVIDLIRRKQAGRPVEPEKPIEEQPRVINLMDALRASVEGDIKKKPAAARSQKRRPAAKGKKKAAG